MLKVIALAGMFVFTSAVSTSVVTGTSKKASSKVIPGSPQPQGFCFPGTC